MQNAPKKEQTNGARETARNLFFQTGLTQAQIAELVSVSQKTVSIWMNEGKWKFLKESAELAPAALIDQMVSELAEIHYNIAAREPGKRFATLHEAEIRRKIMMSIKGMKQQQTTAVHGEVMANFLEYIRRQNIDVARSITTYVEKYLVGEKKLAVKEPFIRYSLPGQIEIPVPAGLPDKNTPAPPSPDSDPSTGDLNKAA